MLNPRWVVTLVPSSIIVFLVINVGASVLIEGIAMLIVTFIRTMRLRYPAKARATNSCFDWIL